MERQGGAGKGAGVGVVVDPLFLAMRQKREKKGGRENLLATLRPYIVKGK